MLDALKILNSLSVSDLKANQLAKDQTKTSKFQQKVIQLVSDLVELNSTVATRERTHSHIGLMDSTADSIVSHYDTEIDDAEINYLLLEKILLLIDGYVDANGQEAFILSSLYTAVLNKLFNKISNAALDYQNELRKIIQRESSQIKLEVGKDETKIITCVSKNPDIKIYAAQYKAISEMRKTLATSKHKDMRLADFYKAHQQNYHTITARRTTATNIFLKIVEAIFPKMLQASLFSYFASKKTKLTQQLVSVLAEPKPKR